MKILVEYKRMRARGSGVTTVKMLEKLIRRGWNIRKGCPRIFRRWEILPMDKVLESVTNLSAVEDRVNRSRGRVRENVKRLGRSMRMKFGRV